MEGLKQLVIILKDRNFIDPIFQLENNEIRKIINKLKVDPPGNENESKKVESKKVRK